MGGTIGHMNSPSEIMTRLAAEERAERALVCETLGLAVPAYEVLRLLAAVSESRSVGALREATGLSRSQATDAVRALENRGWIEAWADRDDQRRVVLRITVRGQDAYRYFRGRAAAAGLPEVSQWTEIARALLAECHLTATEALVLAFVSEHAQVTVGLLSRALQLPQSTSSVALGSLRERGLVRAEDAPDKRSRTWTLTQAGEAAFERIAGIIRRMHE